VAESEPANIGRQADADRAALRDQAHVADEARRVAQLLDVDRAAGRRVEHAHAVRTVQQDPGFPADTNNLGLQPGSLLAALGEAAVEDRRGLCSLRSERPEALEDAPVADAERHHVGRFRQFLDARIAALSEDFRIFRVDRIDSPLEADAFGGNDQRSAERRPLGCADNGDRFRAQEGVKGHEQAFF
jgi:hypothetical protein